MTVLRAAAAAARAAGTLLLLAAALVACDAGPSERVDAIPRGDAAEVAALSDSDQGDAADAGLDVAADATALNDGSAVDVPPVRVPSGCWQTACNQLWSACGQVAACAELSNCVAKTDRADCKAKAGAAASALWMDLQTCAAANCRDPYAGTCAERCGKAKPPEATCACDPQCEAYGDCCWDYAAECKKKPTPATSCVGLCGQFLGNDVCNCDDACVDYNDCCADFLPVCKPQTDASGSDADSVGSQDDAVDGPDDASAVDAAADVSPDSL